MKEDSIFSRNPRGTTEVFKKAKIGIAGCGGLGSNVAVALTRAGVEKFVLADFDVVEKSNLNRQHFFLNHIGIPKVVALKEQLLKINSHLICKSIHTKISENNIGEAFGDCDVLVEAFDNAQEKVMLINYWRKNFPDKFIICGNGMGGFGNIEDIKIRKLGKLIIIGDEVNDMDKGLLSTRVGITALKQADEVLRVLMENSIPEDPIFS
ncbi:MAG: sulfur carrier protein ThiS adenylyltransferase ThiF [Deltaproteobacteria bacterium]|nr:sulfur carrier protein ThiS adenylyltransferase ThiF [Deltaproteobacteria bacterium]